MKKMQKVLILLLVIFILILASSVYFREEKTSNIHSVTIGEKDFIPPPASGEAPLTIEFKALPSAGERSIDYGDGSKECYEGDESCTMLNHTYTKVGTYTAILYRHLPTTELGRVIIHVTEKKEVQKTVSLHLLSPNGGEIFKVGERVNIFWKSQNNVNGKVMLGLVDKDGKIVKELTNYIDGINDSGSHLWTVDSSVVPGMYRVIVQTSEKPQYAQDESDNFFEIKSI